MSDLSKIVQPNALQSIALDYLSASEEYVGDERITGWNQINIKLPRLEYS